MISWICFNNNPLQGGENQFGSINEMKTAMSQLLMQVNKGNGGHYTTLSTFVFETLHYKKFLKSQVNSKIQGIVRQYDFFLNVMKTTVTKTKQATFCVIS